MSKKLLICSPCYAVYGGVESIVADLSRKLPSRGWEVIVGLGKGSRFNIIEKYKAVYPDLTIVEIDGTKGTRQARLEGLSRVICNVRPDIVLSARVFDAYEAAASLKTRQGRPRLAIMIYAYEPPYFFDAQLYREVIDLCLVDAKLIASALERMSGIDAERVVCLPGGVKAPQMLVGPRKQGQVLKIGYVGRLEQSQKLIFDLLPFLKLLDENGIRYSMDVVGTGPQAAEVETMTDAWVKSGVLKFHGWQDSNSLYTRIFPGMDCLVHFAYTEGVTIAPREAMAHGVVPVISEFTGLRAEGQFLNEVNSLTFPVGDMEKAAFNIKRLVTEPGLMERLSSNAMNSQKGKYTLEGSMDAWAEALNRCLEMPPASGKIPKLHFPADGRLARMGISPRLAQRVRDLLGRTHIHSDPGSEWPTCSGLMMGQAEEKIMRFASEYEKGLG